ncbi:MAG TPA: hypothetical protein G4O10_02895 [Dehalococcoidia bacterium]|nr:hypothetical protein [Dehalococcoidia bacterium]
MLSRVYRSPYDNTSRGSWIEGGKYGVFLSPLVWPQTVIDVIMVGIRALVVNARAYTVGDDVVFGIGKYQPLAD